MACQTGGNLGTYRWLLVPVSEIEPITDKSTYMHHRIDPYTSCKENCKPKNADTGKAPHLLTKRAGSGGNEEEEIFDDEEDDMYSDESESSGDHDDDGEVEPPTQAAFNALLKRWLHAENQSHLAGLVVMWEIQTSALPVILAASEAFQTARDLELVNITNEMRTWLTPNDPTGEYGKYWEE
eukprot:gene27185-35706_t